MSGQVDKLGRAMTKTCDCGVVSARTVKKCAACGAEFVGRMTVYRREKAKKAPPVVMAATPFTRVRLEPKPEIAAAVLPVAAKVAALPADSAFRVTQLPRGGLLLEWPDFGVRFTLTPRERSIVRSAA